MTEMLALMVIVRLRYFRQDEPISRHFHTPLAFTELSLKSQRSEQSEQEKAKYWIRPEHVKDKNGDPRPVVASGHYLFLPHIQRVGDLRMRYPIMPLYESGNTVWKELKALEDSLGIHAVGTNGVTLSLRGGGDHQHDVYLNALHIKKLLRGETITAFSAVTGAHSHFIKMKAKASGVQYELVECDKNTKCFDNHDRLVVKSN